MLEMMLVILYVISIANEVRCFYRHCDVCLSRLLRGSNLCYTADTFYKQYMTGLFIYRSLLTKHHHPTAHPETSGLHTSQYVCNRFSKHNPISLLLCAFVTKKAQSLSGTLMCATQQAIQKRDGR